MRLFRLGSFVLGLLGIAGAATHAPAKDFYQGKTLRLIVSSPPGGGYDLYSRLLARHLPKHIAGNPKIIVQNMPGGSHMIATRYMYSVAKKDGTVIASLSRSIPDQELFRGTKAAGFKATNFNWLGSITAEVQGCVVRGDLAIKTFDDLKNSQKTLAMGGQARGIETSDYGRLVREVLGANLRVVDGYTGTGPRRLALEQTELDGICGWSWSSIKGTSQQWLDSGFIRVIGQLGIQAHPEMTKLGAPLLIDMAPDEESRRVMEVLFSRLAIGRPILTTPGVPKERVALLRKAFMDTMKDSEFLKEARLLKLEVNPLTGEQVEELLEKVSNYPPEILVRVKQIVFESK